MHRHCGRHEQEQLQLLLQRRGGLRGRAALPLGDGGVRRRAQLKADGDAAPSAGGPHRCDGGAGRRLGRRARRGVPRPRGRQARGRVGEVHDSLNSRRCHEREQLRLLLRRGRALRAGAPRRPAALPLGDGRLRRRGQIEAVGSISVCLLTSYAFIIWNAFFVAAFELLNGAWTLKLELVQNQQCCPTHWFCAEMYVHERLPPEHP